MGRTSAVGFGHLLMRQTFLALPRDFEEAAAIYGAAMVGDSGSAAADGQARPGGLSHVSITRHGKSFMAADGDQQPRNQKLTIGLASFGGAPRAARNGAAVTRHASRMAPLAVVRRLQRRFVESFVSVE